MSTDSPSSDSCLSSLLLAVVAAWIVGVCVVVQVVAWFTDQYQLLQEQPTLGPKWLAIQSGQALLIAGPALLVYFLSRRPSVRATCLTWAVAAAGSMLFSPLRLFFNDSTQSATITEIGLALLSSLLLALALRRRGPAGGPAGAAWALALAPLVALPLLLWGSLGSPADAVLDLFAGLGLGLVAGLLLDGFLFRPLAALPPSRARDLGLGGPAACVTLIILAASYGFGGTPLLLLMALPLLGLGVAALAAGPWRAGRSGWLAVTLLVGLPAAAVLMFVDPAELVLALGSDPGEALTWALGAAALALGIGLLASLVLALAASLSVPPAAPSTPRRLAGWGAVLLAWVTALLVYTLGGQPGFHGDWLFVELRSQADVSSATTMPDLAQRRGFVYTTLVQNAQSSQASLRGTLDRLHIAYHPYYLVNGLEVNGGLLLRAYLSTRPDVARVLDSPHLRPLPRPPAALPADSHVPPSSPQWNITSIGADRVWNELHVTGQGIVVGQSDTGVQGDHPALRGNYRGLQGGDDYNWLDPWNHTAHPTDVEGHGTHTLGIAAGGLNIGVAPGAQWMACVNLARDLGNPPVYLNCLEFMLAPWPQAGDPFKDGDPSRAADVLNNSWGCPDIEGCDPGVMAPAVAALRAAGIFVVASAGNSGPYCGSVRDPIALYADVYSVGAVGEDGHLADFSSRGPVTVDGSDRPKPDISAPGVNVYSALPDNGYGYLDGTSMAGPHVVGTVALMWSANPKLRGNIDQTAKILTETARPYTAAPDSSGNCPNSLAVGNEAGAGLLDAYAAVAEALKQK